MKLTTTKMMAIGVAAIAVWGMREAMAAGPAKAAPKAASVVRPSLMGAQPVAGAVAAPAAVKSTGVVVKVVPAVAARPQYRPSPRSPYRPSRRPPFAGNGQPPFAGNNGNNGND